ncbi:carbon-nitrogen hydrolase family protein [Massilia sp. CCM 8733]|uniref:Carbon-nitrogen hydrolase family protein n=1 Tax=Massilia mucilaginosa TaxID=2609282 RepID=A0ABX0P142_9BURK|nr:carbon-nitrogen hydrolase family protein [Massilia mucilaginosa]NHZ92758.1 carbon-nitrogen hydrolase family protein [Massilia mucilaginosa]
MKVGIVQLDCKINRSDSNMRRAERYIDQAIEAGVDLVCLPEAFLTSGNILEVADVAVAIPGAATEALGALARKGGISIIAGLLEKDGEAYYSTAVLIGPDGAIGATYRRVHCFEMERKYLACGDQFACIDTPHGRIGLILGYDLNFPETCRALYQEKVDIIFCPALIPEQFSYVTNQLLTTRAIENQCFIVFVSGVGMNVYAGFNYMGESCVVADPLFLEDELFDFVDGGETLLRFNQDEQFQVIDLDVGRLLRYRESRSLIGDTQPDVYLNSWQGIHRRAALSGSNS